MTVENADYIHELNEDYPEDTHLRSQGAAHIRLVKEAIKSTFPNVESDSGDLTAEDLRRLAGVGSSDDSVADRLDALEDRQDDLGSMADRDVTISSGSPTGGSDGDIWLRYE